MKRLLFIGLASLWAVSASAQVNQNGQAANQGLKPCQVVHQDAAVNTAVTVVTPTPPNGLFVYICGLDLTVSNDSTGAVTQANAQFTRTNWGGWKYTFSTVKRANTNGLDKIFYPNLPIRASIDGTQVWIVSPAANTHAAYS